MTESGTIAHYGLCSVIKGYYMDENSKAILIKIQNGISFWVPKQYIDSPFSTNKNIVQEFIIEKWILRRIGFDLSKN
jgi:hypothetical protein